VDERPRQCQPPVGVVMSLAELDALRAAYPTAEEWMLEGVCASLAGLRGDRAAVEETLESFLGESEALKELAALWAADAPASSSTSGSVAEPGNEIVGMSASVRETRVSGNGNGGERTTGAGASGAGAGPSSRQQQQRGDRAPARETRALRFVEKKPGTKSTLGRSGLERTLKPGDELSPGDLAKSCVNCLQCGKIFDLRAKDGVISQTALAFLEASAKCTHCGNFVEVLLSDGVTKFCGDSSEGASTTAADGKKSVCEAMANVSLADATVDDAEARAIAAKDRLVHFDQTSAKRTTVIDDQSEWYAIDSNAWLDEAERAELKRQAKEMAEAEEEAKRKARTTWTLDLVGRRVAAPTDPSDDTGVPSIDDRASDDALVAAKAIRAALATNEELAQGGGGAAAAAAETARELERRVFANPDASHAPRFLAADPEPAGHSKSVRSTRGSGSDVFASASASAARRVLDDNPFDAVLHEIADLGFT